MKVDNKKKSMTILIQSYLEVFYIWLQKWHSKVNAAKRAAMILTKETISPENLSLNGDHLPRRISDSVVTANQLLKDTDVTFDSHFKIKVSCQNSRIECRSLSI